MKEQTIPIGTPLWVAEFGAEYAIPDSIARNPRLEDRSWHNDIAPSFTVKNAGERVRLWVHPVDPKERELPGEMGRFVVARYDVQPHDKDVLNDEAKTIDLYSGDDEAEALATAFRELVNPRFVMLVGAVAPEMFPDVPQDWEGVQLYDRQDKLVVWQLMPCYCNAMCLETADPGEQPFTALERWFNTLNNECLESEGMTPTQPTYDRYEN